MVENRSFVGRLRAGCTTSVPREIAFRLDAVIGATACRSVADVNGNSTKPGSVVVCGGSPVVNILIGGPSSSLFEGSSVSTCAVSLVGPVVELCGEENRSGRRSVQNRLHCLISEDIRQRAAEFLGRSRPGVDPSRTPCRHDEQQREQSQAPRDGDPRSFGGHPSQGGTPPVPRPSGRLEVTTLPDRIPRERGPRTRRTLRAGGVRHRATSPLRSVGHSLNCER